MSYDLHNFVSGQHLYAEQLNEMDNGIKDIDTIINGTSETVTYTDDMADDYVEGYYINQDGNLTPYDIYCYKHILYHGTSFVINSTKSGAVSTTISFFDKNRTCISGAGWKDINGSFSITPSDIPADTSYVTISAKINEKDMLTFTQIVPPTKDGSILYDIDSIANDVDDMSIRLNGGTKTDTMDGYTSGFYISTNGTKSNDNRYCCKYFKYVGGTFETITTTTDGLVNFHDDKFVWLGNKNGWAGLNKKIEKTDVPEGTAYISVSLQISIASNCSIKQIAIGFIGDIAKNYAHEADTITSISASKQARHIVGNVTPLTILHFSDIHADVDAMYRIMTDAKRYEYDDAICTGDIVSDQSGAITSWWHKNVLTCIGNHDTAKYTAGSGYDWTYLSMAQRDEMYISPFKSNWGTISHNSGTSYYYKDYSAQNVRLIVLDAMLYSATANSAEGDAQTAWLVSALNSTGTKHVLIAIHAPHGGSVPVPCSFSRYGRTAAMPTQNDCTTPNAVIDAVANAIDNGLHFIGYLVGHMHQDDIWDATGDKSQLMYTITCAIVSYEGSWNESDMCRDSSMDAYNLVTIDTAHSLVKIVRCGGANFDNLMRKREAICINYDTGEIISE